MEQAVKTTPPIAEAERRFLDAVERAGLDLLAGLIAVLKEQGQPPVRRLSSITQR